MTLSIVAGKAMVATTPTPLCSFSMGAGKFEVLVRDSAESVAKLFHYHIFFSSSFADFSMLVAALLRVMALLLNASTTAFIGFHQDVTS